MVSVDSAAGVCLQPLQPFLYAAAAAAAAAFLLHLHLLLLLLLSAPFCQI